MAIQNLSQIDTVSLSDQVPIGSTSNGGDRRVTVSKLADTVGAQVTTDATAAATTAALAAVNAALPELIDAATAGLAFDIAANTAAITTKADALAAVEIFVSTILVEQTHSKRPLVVSASAVGPVTLTIANQANGGWIYDPDLGATHLSSLDVLNQSAFPVTIAMQNPSVMAIIAGTRYPTIPSQQNGSFDPLASNSWTSSTAAPADVLQNSLASSTTKAPVVDAVNAGLLTIEPKKYVAPPSTTSFASVLNAAITAGYQTVALQENKVLSVSPAAVGSALQITSNAFVQGYGASGSVAQLPNGSVTTTGTMFNQYDGWSNTTIENMTFDANYQNMPGATSVSMFGITSNTPACSNLTFRNVVFKNIRNSVGFMLINGPGWTFQTCTFANSSNCMLTIGGQNTAPDDLTFDSCKFTGWTQVNGSTCITMARNPRNLRFLNCSWLNTAAIGQFSIEAPSTPGNITTAQGMQVIGCYFDGNDGDFATNGNGNSGVGISTAANDSLFIGNIFRRCNMGFAFETGGHRNIIAHNIIQNGQIFHNISAEVDGICQGVTIVGNRLRFQQSVALSPGSSILAIQVRNMNSGSVKDNSIDVSQLVALSPGACIAIGANVGGQGANWSTKITIKGNTGFASRSEDGGTTQSGFQGLQINNPLLNATIKGLDTVTNFTASVPVTTVGASRAITSDIPAFLNPRDIGRTVTYSGGGVGTITSVTSPTAAVMTITTAFTSATPAAGSVTLGAQQMVVNDLTVTENEFYGLQYAFVHSRGLGTGCRVYNNNVSSNSGGQFFGDWVTNDPEIRENLGPSGWTLHPQAANDAAAAALTPSVKVGRFYANGSVVMQRQA